MQAVYKYGSTNGDVVARQEIGLETQLPSKDELITLQTRDGERQFKVVASFPPSVGMVETEEATREVVTSTYTIVVEDPDR